MRIFGTGRILFVGLLVAVGALALPSAAAAQSSFISIQKTGNGTGVITSQPAGINCGPAAGCAAEFEVGSAVTLTAAPAASSEFTGWAEPGCSDAALTCTVTLDETPIRIVSPTFKLKKVTLTVSRTGSGSGGLASTPEGIDCGEVCTAEFDYGTSVQLSATPASPDSIFAGWGGDGCSGTGTTCTVTMDRDRSISADFPKQQFSVTTTSSGSGSGNVVSDPPGIDCGRTGDLCSAWFDVGTSVQLTATPSVGSDFTAWSGGQCAGGDPVCTFTIDRSQSINTEYAWQTRDLAISLDGDGAGTVVSSPSGIVCPSQCSYSFNHNLQITLTAQPEHGSRFAGWTGICEGSGLSCDVWTLFDHEITATFSKDGPPLQTTITSAPKRTIRARKAVRVRFTFKANRPGATFICKLDSGPSRPCASSAAYRVKPGSHRFQVYAIDLDGVADPTPAKASFKVVKPKKKKKKR